MVNINEIREGKGITARSNACFKCGMIGLFVKDCMADIMDTADDIVSIVMVNMQETVTAN